MFLCIHIIRIYIYIYTYTYIYIYICICLVNAYVNKTNPGSRDHPAADRAPPEDMRAPGAAAGWSREPGLVLFTYAFTKHIHIYIYIYICVCIYVYIYMYNVYT